MIQKLPIAGLALCCALGATGVQQSEENLIFYDTKGNLKLYANKSSFAGNIIPGESLTFDLIGDPVLGISRVQSLEFRCLHAKVDAVGAGNGSFKLSAATLDKNVVVTIDGETEDGKSVSRIETQLLHFVEKKAAVITLPVPFVFTNTVTTAEFVRTVKLEATSGVIRMLPLDQAGELSNPIVSTDMQGPIRVEMTTDNADETANDSTLLLTADSLTYNADKGVLRVEGNVTVVSTERPPSGEVLSFTMHPPWIDVVLDKDWKVVNMIIGAGTGSMSSKGGGE